MKGIMFKDAKYDWIKSLPPGALFHTRRIMKPQPEDFEDGKPYEMGAGQAPFKRFIEPTYKKDTTIYVKRATKEYPNKMFCPERLAEIFLDVVDVRGERLQDISEVDCKLEGVQLPRNTATMWDGIYKAGYQAMWESISGKGSWDKNPYVFVCVLRRRNEPD